MSNNLKIFEESKNVNEINDLLNSPIISKKIPEIQPSPLILCSKKRVSNKIILGNEKRKHIYFIESISNQETDNEVDINSSDEEEYLQENQEEINVEGKLYILDKLKKFQGKNLILENIMNFKFALIY